MSMLVRNVIVIFVTVFIMSLVTAFTSWFLPIYLERLGGISFVALVFTFAKLLSIPPILVGGLAADVFGRKPVILSASLMYVIAFMLFFTENVVLVALAVPIVLFAVALNFPAVMSLLSESVDKNFVSTALSWYRLVVNAAAIIGSLAVGYISTHFSVKHVILICLFSSLVAFLTRLILVETRRSDGEKRSVNEIVKTLIKTIKAVHFAFKTKILQILTVAVIVVSIGSGMLEVYMPIFFSNWAKLSYEEIGIIEAIVSLVSVICFAMMGFIVRKLGWTVALTMALIIEGSIIAALPYAPKIISLSTPLIAFAIFYSLLSAASTLDQVASDTMIVSITRPETRGTIIASLGSISLLSRALSPATGGYLITSWSYIGVFIVTAAMYLLGSILIMNLRRWIK